jgi:hypothetical protein
MSPERERWANMTDPERDDLLRRLAESERARRRWKVLALAGTPVLAALLVMMAAFGTSSYLMLRDALRRESEGRELVLDVSQCVTLMEPNVELLEHPDEPAKMPLEPE